MNNTTFIQLEVAKFTRPQNFLLHGTHTRRSTSWVNTCTQPHHAMCTRM